MWYMYTNIYSNIIVYQKYKGTAIKVGCATRSLYTSSGPAAEGVPTNNQGRWGSGPFRLCGGLDKARHIVPTTLLVSIIQFQRVFPNFDKCLRFEVRCFVFLFF